LSRVYDALGFDEAAKGDEVFRQLVLARIVEPTSKEDSVRVVEEVGIKPASYRATRGSGPAALRGAVRGDRARCGGAPHAAVTGGAVVCQPPRFFDNLGDTEAGLRDMLAQSFAQVAIDVVGSVAVFAAYGRSS
jgi:hypothetical protein